MDLRIIYIYIPIHVAPREENEKYGKQQHQTFKSRAKSAAARQRDEKFQMAEENELKINGDEKGMRKIAIFFSHV